jgi:WD40 repeat protein
LSRFAFQVWDTRQQKCIQKFEEHEDYISQMIFVPDKANQLIAVGYFDDL